MCVAAILLLLLSECTGQEKKEEVPQQEDISQYAMSLEERLTKILSSIDGAGKTRVMITIRSGTETVYARNGRMQMESGKNEEEQSYVVLRSGSTEKGMELKTITPLIQGVAVVCEGAEIPQVRQSITETVTATLGVGASHVSVVKMQSERN